MSTGNVHVSASSGLSIGFLTSAIITGWFSVFIPLYIGTSLGILLTPDKDVDPGDISYKMIRKLFFTDYVWSTFWKPYRYAFKHRSIWSHGIFISTLIRWIYLVCPFIVVPFNDQNEDKFIDILLAQGLAFFHVSVIIGVYLLFGWKVLVIIFIGNMLSDVLHWLMDINWKILR